MVRETRPAAAKRARMFDVLINDKPALHDFDVIAESGPAAADTKVFKDVTPAADGKLHLKFDPHSNPAFVNGIEITPGIPGKMRPIRIIAQDHAYTGKDGRYWEPDRYAKGGQFILRRDRVLNTGDPELYHGERFGNITYVIPVASGRYGITFHFVEAWFGPDGAGRGGLGSRLFDILCNGVALKRNFDIYREAGGSNRAITWTAHDLQPKRQGKLAISLVPVENYASINALEIFDESR